MLLTRPIAVTQGAPTDSLGDFILSFRIPRAAVIDLIWWAMLNDAASLLQWLHVPRQHIGVACSFKFMKHSLHSLSPISPMLQAHV